MKKIYLSFGLVALAFAGMSQRTFAPMQQVNDHVHVKQTMQEAPANHVDHSADRGGFWSDDFSGTATWTTSNTGNPPADWTIGSAGPTGSFSAGMGPIASTSGGNFAMFDSDALGSGSSSQDAIIHTGPIDLTLQPVVAVEFESYYRQFQGSCYVIASTDGVNWTQFQVHSTLAGNATTANPEVVSVNVTSVIGGSSTAYIGFQYVGGWDYAWMVDDVSLVAPPADEISLQTSGWSADGIQYTIMPGSESAMLDHIFYGSMTNTGINQQTGTNLEVTTQSTVLTGTDTTLGAGVYFDTTTTTHNFGSTNGQFDVIWKADYDAYALDDDNTNNFDTAYVEVTDNEFGRDALNYQTYDGGGLWNGAGEAYVMGLEYDMQTTRDISIIRCAIEGTTIPGVTLYGQIYEVDQATGDFVLVYDGSGSVDGEFTVGNYMLSTAGDLRWVNIPIQGGSFTMNAGSWYIVCVGHYGGADDAILAEGQIEQPDFTSFLYDGTDATWYYFNSTPAIRAVFSPAVTLGVDEEAGNLSLAQNVPNPFDANSRVNYSLTETADVTFEVTDVTGKVVERIDMGTVSAGEHNIQLNADNYSKGVYFYTLTAGAERLTKQMVVTK